jgi:hypothetical protein
MAEWDAVDAVAKSVHGRLLDAFRDEGCCIVEDEPAHAGGIKQEELVQRMRDHVTRANELTGDQTAKHDGCTVVVGLDDHEAWARSQSGGVKLVRVSFTMYMIDSSGQTTCCE